MVLLGCLIVMGGRLERTGMIPAWATAAYPLVMTAMIAGYGILLGHRTSLASAGLILSSWLGITGWRGYCSLRQVVVGIDYIALGMILFTLAVLTSLVKGGVLTRRVAMKSEKLPDLPGG
jgi:hypothetical protein